MTEEFNVSNGWVMHDPNPVVTRDGSGYIDLHNGKHLYWISEESVSTPDGLINKIRHLCSKRWMTWAHYEQLIDLARVIMDEKRLKNSDKYGNKT